MEEEEEQVGENYNIKINFNNQDIDLLIDSNFDSFIQNICNILKISLEEINSFGLSYTDEDGDNILITTEDDYKLFFQQVKEKIVYNLIIEKKDPNKYNSNLNQINESINNQSNLEYSNSINNSQNNNNNQMESKININNSNQNIKNNNNISNSNSNNFENSYNNNNAPSNRVPIQDDVPIDNIVYYYKCTTCSTYPIVCVMYYCDKCSLYLCEKCEKNNDHKHPLMKIKNKDQLLKIKKEENEKIDRKNKEKEKLEQHYHKHSLNNNNYHNNYPTHSDKNYFNNNRNNNYANINQYQHDYNRINQPYGNHQNNNFNYQQFYPCNRNCQYHNNYNPYNICPDRFYNNNPPLHFNYNNNLPYGNNMGCNNCFPSNGNNHTYQINSFGK